jgi:hypothetical protein
MMEAFKAREWDFINQPHADMLDGIFEAARALLTAAGRS